MSVSSTTLHPELRRRIEEVAQQCRRTRLVRCLTRFGLALFVLTGVTTLVFYGVAPGAVGSAVILGLYVAFLSVAAVGWLILPLRTPLSLDQVALYIDEHHPELENRIVSAVEFSGHHPPGASDWIIQKFLEETTPIVRRTSFADLMDSGTIVRLGGSAGILMALSLALIVAFKGAWFPSLAFVLPDQMAKYVTLPFSVEPGDVRVRRGDNQMVWVRSDEPDRKLTVHWRQADGPWQAMEMDRSATDKVYYHQFMNVQTDIEYAVEYGRQRSESFQMTAWTPPEVSAIDLTYRYPEYLEMPPREMPNSGNISAVEGTRVELSVWVNKDIDTAEMVLDSGTRVPLQQRTTGLWTTEIELKHNDRYHIALKDAEDFESEYNPKYRIAVQRDKPPEIRIHFPRGDGEVTMLEEVPFTFKVTDDHGFSEFGIEYQVTGRDPVRLPLHETAGPKVEAEGHHELMLEEMELEPGDFITWTVWARDSKPDRSEYEEMGDPFFLEIRPFQRRYEEAISGGGDMGQQGGGGDEETNPLAKAKDVIIATWNLRRDSRSLLEDEFYRRRNIIIEEQEALRNQVTQGAGMMGQNLDTMRLQEAMRGSLDALRQADPPSPEGRLSEAALRQQEAYQLLLKLQPETSQVQQQQGQGGGGGGGGGERPDISALELARNRNFYAQENLSQQQQEAAQEVLNKIKELAQRQQVVNEEIEKLVSELQNATTEEERERLQRRLERLQEELRQNLERIDEVQQDVRSQPLPNEQIRQTDEALDEARRQTNRSLEQLRDDELQQARSSGARAMDAFRDIEEHLQQLSRGGAAERMRELQEEMKRLQEMQRDIAQNAEAMQELHRSPSLDNQDEMKSTTEEMLERKAELLNDFTNMMDDASDLAERAQDSQELMSRDLGDWLRETSREGIVEDIEESRPLLQFGVWDSVRRAEDQIAEKIQRAARALDRVAESLVSDDLDALRKALEQLDELMGGAGSREGERVARAPGEEDPEGRQAGGRAGEDGDEAGMATDEEGTEAGRGQGRESEREGAGVGEEREDGQPGGRGERSDDASDEEREGMAPGEGEEGQAPGEEEGQEGQQGGGGRGGDQTGREADDRQQVAQDGGEGQEGGEAGGQPGGDANQGGARPFGGDRWNTGPTPLSPTGPSITGGGGWGDWLPRDMRQFIDGDYQEWLERLRNAEALLPEDSEYRTDITRLREQVEAMRRQWRDRNLAPQFDLFLEMVAKPLVEAADELQREIERRLNEKEFILVDEGRVPERYRERVAEYFKNLAESEGAR